MTDLKEAPTLEAKPSPAVTQAEPSSNATEPDSGVEEAWPGVRLGSRLAGGGSPPPDGGISDAGLAHPTATRRRAALARTLQRQRGNAFVQRTVLGGRTVLGDTYEREADRFAELASGNGRNEHPRLSRARLAVQRAPEEGSAPKAPPPPSPGATGAAAGSGPDSLFADEAAKHKFLDQLEKAVYHTAEEALAGTAWSAAGCPYITRWLAYYRRQSPAHALRAMRKFAPETAKATTAKECIAHICGRVRRGISTWVDTGKITGVPEGVSAEGSDDGAGEGAASAAGSGGGVQLKSRDGRARATGDPQAIRAQLGTGHPLDSGVRSRMESVFGAGFGHVRVYTDDTAGRLSSDLDARAFTVGHDVAFGRGEYQPGTPVGDALIAHELAHTVQQRGANAAYLSTSQDKAVSTTLERDADFSAVSAVASLWAGCKAGALHLGRRALPRLRSGLRLQRCTIEAKEVPVGARAPVAGPPSVQAPIATPPRQLSLGQLQDRLRLMKAVLKRMASQYCTDPLVVAKIGHAYARINATGKELGLTNAFLFSIPVAQSQSILEHTEKALILLEKVRLKQTTHPDEWSRKRLVAEVDQVRSRYLDVLPSLFKPDVAALYNKAEQAAAGLPRALIEVSLRKVEQGGPPYYAPVQAEIYEWVQWVRIKLNLLQAKSQELATARREKPSDVPRLEKEVLHLAQLTQFSIEALQHWDNAVMAFKYLGSKGNLIRAAYQDLVNIWVRCRRMRKAAMAGDVTELRRRVLRHRNDPHVTRLYKGLPLIVFGSSFLVSFGIILVSALVTAGVGGLVTGAITTTTRTGAVLAFLGTAALEALTFTTVSRGLQTALGQKPQGSLIADLVWNFGLFTVLGGLARGIRAVLPPHYAMLQAPLQATASYPVLHYYGMLRFRVSEERWPTDDEIDVMAAQNLIMLAGLTVGLRVAQRWLPTKRAGTPALRQFYRKYGWRFEALEAARGKLHGEIGRLVQGNKITDPTAIKRIRQRAAKLEAEFKRVLAEVKTDKTIDLKAIRAELKKARTLVIEGSAELLQKELGLVRDVGLQRAGGERQFTYERGKTGVLEKRLRGLGLDVTKTSDPASRLHTLSARLAKGGPWATFQERASLEALRMLGLTPSPAPKALPPGPEPLMLPPGKSTAPYLMPGGYKLPGRVSMPKGLTPLILGQTIEPAIINLVGKHYGVAFPAKSPSAVGPDLVPPKGATLPFDIGEIKPMNARGVRKFWWQIDNWRDYGWRGGPSSFQGKAALFVYDANGNIYLYGIYKM
jgi:hypothetical protein